MGWGGRWEGVSGWGDTCRPMDDSCQCMAKTTTAELPWQSPISDPLSLTHGLAEWASWAGLAAPGARVSDARGQLMPEKGGVLF